MLDDVRAIDVSQGYERKKPLGRFEILGDVGVPDRSDHDVDGVEKNIVIEIGEVAMEKLRHRLVGFHVTITDEDPGHGRSMWNLLYRKCAAAGPRTRQDVIKQ